MGKLQNLSQFSDCEAERTFDDVPFSSPLSKHARERKQQRGINPCALGFLEEFGSVVRSHGADLLIFDKKARRRLQHHLGGARALKLVEPLLGVYAVISDNGTVMTVGHRDKRVRRS
ncbi:MAG: hypothetical protein ACOY4O_16685 [Pseudomonadota bacterium]